jgi:hypothetical protein
VSPFPGRPATQQLPGTANQGSGEPYSWPGGPANRTSDPSAPSCRALHARDTDPAASACIERGSPCRPARPRGPSTIARTEIRHACAVVTARTGTIGLGGTPVVRGGASKRQQWTSRDPWCVVVRLAGIGSLGGPRRRYAKGGRVPPYRCASGPKVLSVGTLVRGACSRDGVDSLMTEDPRQTRRNGSGPRTAQSRSAKSGGGSSRRSAWITLRSSRRRA